MTGARSGNGLWVEQTGESGDILLLIHGLGANGAVWDPLLAIAAGDWRGRILVPDLAGHGRSVHRENYSLGGFAADIAALLPPACTVSIIGHSLGGAVGALLASGWFGVDVDAALALSVKSRWSVEEISKGRAVAQNPVRWLASRDEAMDRYRRASGLAGVGADLQRSVEAGIAEAGGQHRVAADPKIFGSAALGIDSLMKVARSDFALATGSKDPMAPAADMAAAGFQPSVIDGAGHNVHVEVPGAVWEMFRSMQRSRAA